MQYELSTWEENGYDDSDGFTAYWDSEKNTVEKVMTWTTRFGAGPAYNFEKPTPEVVEQAIQWLAQAIFAQLKRAEEMDILTPQDAPQGTILRVVTPHKSRKLGRTIEVGEKIRVNTCSAFGTFYRNGYNKPNRSNRTVMGTIQGAPLPATFISIPLAKCRLDKEPIADDLLLARAKELACNCQFGAALSGRFAWDTTNKAKQVLTTKQGVL